MWMIRLICNHRRLDKIRNEVIREKVALTPVENKMREAKFRWLVMLRQSIQMHLCGCLRVLTFQMVHAIEERSKEN